MGAMGSVFAHVQDTLYKSKLMPLSPYAAGRARSILAPPGHCITVRTLFRMPRPSERFGDTHGLILGFCRSLSRFGFRWFLMPTPRCSFPAISVLTILKLPSFCAFASSFTFQAKKAHDTGLSIVRGLFFEWPEIDQSYSFSGQYMYGDDIMVAPVTAPVDPVLGESLHRSTSSGSTCEVSD